MKFYKVAKKDLKFDETIPCVTTLVKLPLLVTKDLKVLVGNGQREMLDDTVKVAVYKDECDFATSVLKELDLYLCEENSYDRLMTIQKEFQKFIYKERQQHEQSSMFEYVEKRMITEELYQKTAEYNFEKHKKKKKENEDKGFMSLFEEGDLK